MIKSIDTIKNEKKRSVITMENGETVYIFNATVKEYGLYDGQDISYSEVERIAKEGEEHIAFVTAIDILSRSLKSQNEIRDNLSKKKFSPEAIDKTISKLLGYHYLSDEQYAESYVNYKGGKIGRRKLIYDLTAVKGIPKPVAEQVVYEKYSDDAELEKAVKMAEKCFEKQKKKRNRLRERVWSYLAMKGFETEIISNALSMLDFDEEDDIF